MSNILHDRVEDYIHGLVPRRDRVLREMEEQARRLTEEWGEPWTPDEEEGPDG